MRRNVAVASLSLGDVLKAGAQNGIVIESQSVGPIVQLRANLSTGQPAGSISAAVLPGGRLHVESYKALSRARNGALLKLSPGMFLFIACIAYGYERGCKDVYGLAIDDNPEQHIRLVRYLCRFGGVAVRRVGESLADVPDRLLYGGRGTVIRGNIQQMLERSEGMIERATPIVPPLLIE